MANIAKFNSRVVMKHDTKAAWDAATNFIPLEGEIIVYTDLNRMKIGNGVDKVYDLPFSKVDLPLAAGEAEGSLVINEGSARGISSIAGGTTDKELIESLVGQLASNIVTLHPSEARGALSIALGADNITNTGGSVAMGYDNISGGKGYYFDDFNGNTITLSTTRRTSTLIKPSYPASVDWAAGDRLFMVNEDRIWLTIASVNGNKITVNEDIGNVKYTASLTVFSYSKPNDRTIINIDKPESGVVDIGWGAFGIGTQNTVVGSNAYSVGYNNKVAGDFGTAFGQENLVGYSALATGIGNKALGKASFVSGNGNTATGLASTAEGQGTTASGKYSSAEGNDAVASGESSHAEGTATTASGKYTHAEGFDTDATAEASHAEGSYSKATSAYAHSEGYKTTASGQRSHAEGDNSTASGYIAHAEGYSTTSAGTASHTEGHTTNTGSGNGPHAEGYLSEATGDGAHAEGQSTIAEGSGSHAEGYDTEAKSEGAHAEGRNTVASGIASHAEGTGSRAEGNYSHAEGGDTKTAGQYSHTEGHQTYADAHGGHAEGTDIQSPSQGSGIRTPREIKVNSKTLEIKGPVAWGRGAHAEGSQTLAYGYASHAEGDSSNAIGEASHAEGKSSNANGEASHAEGYSKAIEAYSHAEGYDTQALKYASHAEGLQTKSNGKAAHTEGENTLADSNGAHAEGTNIAETGDAYLVARSTIYPKNNTTVLVNGPIAYNRGSHAEGVQTFAANYAAHAEGLQTDATGIASHAGGEGTIAKERAQTAIGKYNTANSGALFSVGNGTGGSARSDAFNVYEDRTEVKAMNAPLGCVRNIWTGTYVPTENKVEVMKTLYQDNACSYGLKTINDSIDTWILSDGVPQYSIYKCVFHSLSNIQKIIISGYALRQTFSHATDDCICLAKNGRIIDNSNLSYNYSQTNTATDTDLFQPIIEITIPAGLDFNELYFSMVKAATEQQQFQPQKNYPRAVYAVVDDFGQIGDIYIQISDT